MGKKREETFAEETVLDLLGKSYSDIKILQMGAIEHKEPEPRMSAADWYGARGVRKVVSIDLNGQDGALTHDLDYPIPKDLHAKFDLVTNYGTGEHVNDQYSFFRNCHDACKSNGVMIHLLLHEGFLPGHGRYYYSQETTFRLARMCSYRLVYLQNYSGVKTGRRGFLVAAFQNRAVSSFPGKSRFLQRARILDTGDTRRTSDYNAAGHGLNELEANF